MGVAEAVEEQVEEDAEASEGTGRPPVLLGWIGVGGPGRSRLVTSPSGNGAFRWRLAAADEGVEPRGVAALVAGFIFVGMAPASACASRGDRGRRGRNLSGEESCSASSWAAGRGIILWAGGPPELQVWH